MLQGHGDSSTRRSLGPPSGRGSRPPSLRCGLFLLLASAPLLAPPASAQSLFDQGCVGNQFVFSWTLRWNGVKLSPVAPNAAAPLPPFFAAASATETLVGAGSCGPFWEVQAWRGDADGDGIFEEFLFQARHRVGPHGEGANPSPGRFYIDTRFLPPAPGLVNVPLGVPGGPIFLPAPNASNPVATTNPQVVDHRGHPNTFTLRYQARVAGQGATFELGGGHPQVVPEPLGIVLLSTGLAGVAAARMRRRR